MQVMQKRVTLTITILLCTIFITPPLKAAPLADFHLKTNGWQTEYSGDIGQNTNTVNLSDLGFEEENKTSFTLTLRHSVPLIPNIKIQQTALDIEGTATLDVGQFLEITDITFQDDVTTKLDLTHTDFTVFYSFLAVDLGITARNFDTEGSVRGSNGTSIVESDVEISGTIPMLYLGLDVDLPSTGAYLHADLNTVSYEDNSLSDLSAALGYRLMDSIPLTTELGYRRMQLEINDLDDLEGDFTIDGWFVSLGLEF